MRTLIGVIAAWGILAFVGTGWSQSGGWVLVLPPIKRMGEQVEWIDAPITEWSYDSAHDTAASCERARRSHLDGTMETIKLNPKGSPGFELAQELLVTNLGSRCVPYEIWWGGRR